MGNRHARAALIVGIIGVLVAVVGVGWNIYTTCSEQAKYELPATADVLGSGVFGNSLYMGLDTSEHVYGWARLVDDAIRIEYPGASTWGVWYVTAGRPLEDPAQRMYMDFSRYSTLSIELKGNKGDIVRIALKDRDDLDDGKESKHAVELQSDDWHTYEIDLKKFVTADLRKLYVLVSLVFANEPQTLLVRTVRFK